MGSLILTDFPAEQLQTGHSPPRVLGQYRLLGQLGAGSMGQVHKAEHLVMGRVVALKVLAAQFAHDAGIVRRFQREIQVAARLVHPNIVTAYDAALADGYHFLVMEYVAGTDLGRLVEAQGPLPVEQACDYVRQAALGLHHAHEHGLVHCDIKPANLLLRDEGRGARDEGPESISLIPRPSPLAPLVKILDFGLARLAGANLEEVVYVGATPGGSGCEGTPDYMAPERARDWRSVDARSDLYSLGCTFYYLLTGQVPYPGDSWPEKMLRHQFDQATPVTELRSEVPPEVAAIVARLMAKDPAERYATAAELAHVLQTWLGCAVPVAPSAAAVNTQVAVDEPTLVSTTLDGETFPPLVPLCPLADIPQRDTNFVPRRLPWPVSVSIAIVLGLGIAWLARPTATPDDPVVSAGRESLPFRLARDPQQAFAHLADAVTAAQDGDTVLLSGKGPFRTRPLDLRGKSLVLQAAAGSRPRIEVDPDPAIPGWQPLFWANRPLTLHGLELGREVHSKSGFRPGTAHLVFCEDASLRLIDCRLDGPHGRALMVCRDAARVELRDCVVIADASAVCVELGKNSPSEVYLSGCTLLTRNPQGAVVSLWGTGSNSLPTVRLSLERNRLQGGRSLALTGPLAGVEIQADENCFTFGSSLLSCAGTCSSAGWRQAVRWQGRQNCYQGSASWLVIEGSREVVSGLAGWRQYWQSAEPDSREGMPAESVQSVSDRQTEPAPLPEQLR
jgi:serine/threonine-protein kinase